MYCIEITGIPPGGQASDEIKAGWIGLRLPVYPTSSWRHVEPEPTQFGIVAYKVPIMTALYFLRLNRPEAAQWFFDNTELARAEGYFYFSVEACYLVEGLPSFGEEDFSSATINDFLTWIEKESDLVNIIEFLLPKMGVEDAAILKAAPFCPATALMLADLMQIETWLYLERYGDEQLYNEIKLNAKKFFRLLSDFSFSQGNDFEFALADRPVSRTDMMIQAGYLEEVDGLVRLTDEGEAASEEVKRMLKAKDN